ncbi:MAG TPA: T9SS type A sorting domain-containing protein, partial [Lacibacter sp.]|nr:T9SS type A sorting domain-containing protein [Lacibacter sp.]
AGDDGVNITPTRAGANSLQRFYGDDARSEVVLDPNGNILLASSTKSSNFPTQNGFQTGLRGNQDAVVLKLNSSATALTWSTTLGGDADDGGFVLSVNPMNPSNIYVGGGTGSSTNFSGIGTGLQGTYNGGIADGYIARLQDNGGSVAIVRSTYLGTGNIDIVYGVQFDAKGFPYVTGITTGNWPVVNAPYSVANSRQFIAKLQADLSAFVYSTTYGTSGALSPNISPVAFHVDNCENVYVSGWGGGANSFGGTTGYPTSGTNNLPVTIDALQTVTDGSDFYMFVLQANAASQLYGSFFGQNGANGALDHVEGGTSRYDSQGVLYLSACAHCKNVASGLPDVSPFPITPGVFGDINPATTGSGCNLGMVKIRFDYAGSNCIVTSDDLIRNETDVTLTFFPNPGKGKLMMRYDHPIDINSRHNLRIFDAIGKIVYEQQFIVNQSGSQLMIDMSGKGAGMYFVELINKKGNRVATGKFMIE